MTLTLTLGKYSNVTGNSEPADCISCDPGSYCLTAGLGQPTGLCNAGYYCPGGNIHPNTAAFRCPVGYICPSGAPSKAGCSAGSYQNLEGQAECHQCPAGKYCGNYTAHPIDCPSKSYCEAGTALPTTCPNGTYNSGSGLSRVEECVLCPPSKYCTAGEIAGQCAAGFYCELGNWEPRPENMAVEWTNATAGTQTMRGYRCAVGYYCPLGTETMVSCPAGTLGTVTGAWSLESCVTCGETPATEGYLCDGSEPSLCPAGYYCLKGIAHACPVGTFVTGKGSSDATSCVSCPAGTWCNASATTDPTADDLLCPAGHFCPNGTVTPEPCPAGTFRPYTGAKEPSECDACPAGRYCPAGSTSTIVCAAGKYCPTNMTETVFGVTLTVGSALEAVCPAGYYCPGGIGGDAAGLSEGGSLLCTNGSFCAVGVGSPTVCGNGTYCPGGSRAPQLCPGGYYCPAGTDEFLPCPEKFFCPIGISTPQYCKVSLTLALTLVNPIALPLTTLSSKSLL